MHSDDLRGNRIFRRGKVLLGISNLDSSGRYILSPVKCHLYLPCFLLLLLFNCCSRFTSSYGKSQLLKVSTFSEFHLFRVISIDVCQFLSSTRPSHFFHFRLGCLRCLRFLFQYLLQFHQTSNIFLLFLDLRIDI